MSSESDFLSVFPRVVKDGEAMVVVGGLSLLDYFAGLAVVSLGDHDAKDDRKAEWAYDLAEAMLKERAKRLATAGAEKDKARKEAEDREGYAMFG